MFLGDGGKHNRSYPDDLGDKTRKTSRKLAVMAMLCKVRGCRFARNFSQIKNNSAITNILDAEPSTKKTRKDDAPKLCGVALDSIVGNI